MVHLVESIKYNALSEVFIKIPDFRLHVCYIDINESSVFHLTHLNWIVKLLLVCGMHMEYIVHPSYLFKWYKNV